MYLCLSSGDNPRYRQDVLRALAMPLGSHLQFRYRKRWLSPNTAAAVPAMKSERPRALIAYIDQADKTRMPFLIPCRFARIVDVTSLGSTVSLTLQLEGFAFATDLAAANADLRKLATGVPVIQEGKAQRYWWTDLTEMPVSVQATEDLGKWELIVEQLYARSEFATEALFYTVIGIVPAPEGTIKRADGRWLIDSLRDYEVHIYHYHPKETPKKSVSFSVAASSPLIKFSTGTSVSVDSPYDLKRFRFRAESSLEDEKTVLSIRICTEKSDESFGIDLLVTVRRRRLRYAGFGALIGIALAAPTVAPTLASSTISHNLKGIVVLVSLIGGVIAGEIAAFGLKKM